MHIQADRALIPAQTPSVRHLTIKITAPAKQAPAHDRPGVNVALVLDRSGSMDGQKIAMARQFVASELGETLEIVARDVVLDITCSSGVDAMVLNGFAAESAHGRVRVKLGDLVAGQEITIAVAVSCAAHLSESTAFVDCRVTGRDAALYQEPMRVEWRAADAKENERQPVNQVVLVTVADILAQRARATALAANRRGQFEEARRVIRDIVEHLLGLAPGNREILAIVDTLRREELELGHAMEPAMLKARHYASYVAERSRDADGKARRRR